MKNIKTSLFYFFRENITILLVLILFIFFSLTNSDFRKFENFTNIFAYSSILGIVSLGMTFVILLGMFDLSVGGILCLAATLHTIWCMGHFFLYLPPPGSIMFIKELNPLLPEFLLFVLIIVLIGGGFGLLNGAVISYFAVPSIIVTLGTQILTRGIAYTISGGNPLYTVPPYLIFLGQTEIIGFPLSFLVWLSLLIIMWIVLKYTKIGRYIYQVGGNPEAAYAAGVSLIKTKIFAMMISGMLAALAGLIMTGRTLLSHPHYGIGIELDAIAAVVAGGTSLSGGRGGVLNTLTGVFFLSIITNILNLFAVEAIIQYVVKGIFLIIIILIMRILGR
ncbi:MAG: ABC transporter permease [Candidatus Aenigmatarchaeota archaeon]